MEVYKFLIATSLSLFLVSCNQSSDNFDNRNVTEQNYPDLTTTGTVGGGGGVGVKCKTGNKYTFEVLDLHEARLKGLTQLPEPKDQEASINLVLNLFVKQFWATDRANERWGWYSTFVSPIFKADPKWGIWNPEKGKPEPIVYVDSLPLSNDIGKYHIQPNCSLEQIAYYSDEEGELRISKPFWDKLSWLHKAALVGHEVSYLVTRRWGIENQTSSKLMTSESSREFVGELFSTAGAVPKFPTTPGWKCNSQNESTFYARAAGDGHWTLSFELLHETQSPFQIVSEISGIDFEKLIDSTNSYDTAITASVTLTGDSTAPTVNLKISRTGNNPPKIQFFKEDFIPLGRATEFSCEKYK